MLDVVNRQIVQSSWILLHHNSLQVFWSDTNVLWWQELNPFGCQWERNWPHRASSITTFFYLSNLLLTFTPFCKHIQLMHTYPLITLPHSRITTRSTSQQLLSCIVLEIPAWDNIEKMCHHFTTQTIKHAANKHTHTHTHTHTHWEQLDVQMMNPSVQLHNTNTVPVIIRGSSSLTKSDMRQRRKYS